MPEAIPFIPAAISIGSSLFGGSEGGNSAPSPNVYQPGGTGQQDANLQGLLNSNTNLLSGDKNPYSMMNPQIMQAFQQLFNGPGQGGYQSAAGQAGQGYGQVGQQSLDFSRLLSSASPMAIQGGMNAYNMGMDPQKALYNQGLQNTTDLANVHNAQYGLTGQQAAGGVDNATTKFNMDWQNQELERALAGLSGLDSGLKTAGGVGTNAQNIGSAGAGSILAGGAAPFETGQAIGGAQENALTQYLQQLLGPVTSSQSTIGDLAGYMGQGINASASQGSQALANYYAQLTGAGAGATGGAAIGNQLGPLVQGLFNTQATPVPTGGASSFGDMGMGMFSEFGF